MGSRSDETGEDGNFLCYVERHLGEKSVLERGDRPNQANYGFVIWRIFGMSKRLRKQDEGQLSISTSQHPALTISALTISPSHHLTISPSQLPVNVNRGGPSVGNHDWENMGLRDQPLHLPSPSPTEKKACNSR